MPDEFDRWAASADQPFAGWDFSLLSATGRMTESPLPWSYASCALPYLWPASALLDMGTGGGEFLARLQPFPPRAVATEGFPPNVPVARARLAPLGVEVVEVGDDDRLPLPDASFDLVFNRHESYDPAEVARVLRPGGHFVTQQVGGRNDEDLNSWLGVPLDVPWAGWSLETAAAGLRHAGFTLLDQRAAPLTTRYFDIGAVIFYLHAVPWQVRDFTVARFDAPLRALHATIQRQGFVDIAGSRFLIVARRA